MTIISFSYDNCHTKRKYILYEVFSLIEGIKRGRLGDKSRGKFIRETEKGEREEARQLWLLP